MTILFAMWSAAPFAEHYFRRGLADAGAPGGSKHVAELGAFLAGRLGEGVRR
jgi:hypothetical protein